MADSNLFRKWTAIGTGVGAEIAGDDLRVAVARVRPGGIDVPGVITIPRFRERPAAEWGAEWAGFLKSFGGKHLAATVVIPREEVIVRELAVPGVKDQDVPSAISYQLDSLHPYPEDDVVYDWSRLTAATIVIGIARKETVAKYTNLFAEAGVQVSAITLSGSALFAARRTYEESPEMGIAAGETRNKNLEFYGESEAHPMFSNAFAAPAEAFAQRAVSMALAELRLDPETEIQTYERILPPPRTINADIPLSQYALAYAAAITSAVGRKLTRLNLLPPEQRRENSKLVYVPTAALAAIVLLLGLANLFYSQIEERRYQSILQTEVQKLAPASKRADTLDQTAALTRKRIQLIDQYRRQPQQDLDALNELTRLIQPPAWVSAMELTRATVTLAGESEQSAGLLKVLDQSPFFMNSDFTMPLARGSDARSEQFRIRTAREFPAATAAVAQAAPPPPNPPPLSQTPAPSPTAGPAPGVRR